MIYKITKPGVWQPLYFTSISNVAKALNTTVSYVKKCLISNKTCKDWRIELREDSTAAPITIDSPTSEIIDYIESSLR